MFKKILIIFVIIFILIIAIYGLNWYGQTRNKVIDVFSQPLKIYTNENNNYRQYLPLTLADYPDDLINMLLLVEDQAFFEHQGIDVNQIYHAIKDYIFYDKKLRGASTITQQLIKNTLLTNDISFRRKFKEVLMALIFELNFSKDFILLRYLNTVYLGQNGTEGIYGFGMAAYFYFAKNPQNMSLDDMAVLVAMLKGPSYYNPKRNKQRLNDRKQLILKIFYKYPKIYHGNNISN